MHLTIMFSTFCAVLLILIALYEVFQYIYYLRQKKSVADRN